MRNISALQFKETRRERKRPNIDFTFREYQLDCDMKFMNCLRAIKKAKKEASLLKGEHSKNKINMPPITHANIHILLAKQASKRVA